MQNRAASFLERFDNALNNRHTLPAYSGSPFADYQSGDIESFKSVVMELITEYLNAYPSCTLKNKNMLLSLIEKLKTATQYSAVYTHLSIAIQQTEKALLLPHFSALLDYARNFPAFKHDLNQKRSELPQSDDTQQAAVYYNLVEAAEFETDLARVILTSAPKAILEKTNNKIIDYCEKNRVGLKNKEEVLRRQLIQYHLCEAAEFETISPVDKFKALLERDLNHPQHVSECATLHLIFFNYEHIYDVPPRLAAEQLSRPNIHRIVRPNRKGEMFHSETRGRETVIASDRTREFGITSPEQVPEWGKEWHRYEMTPHKYRAGLNPHSPILKHFRSNGIPYIAGPSGTAADCAEGLYFLFFNEISNEEIQEYFNLLAAGEVAQGHHSFHEIILPLCNMYWYIPFQEKCEAAMDNNENETTNKYQQQPWAYLDYQRSYEDFLGDQFKQTEEYKKLCGAYPQYLDPNRFTIESIPDFTNYSDEKNIVSIQRMLRAKKTYAELDKGTLWKDSPLTQNTTLDLNEFKKLSKNNIRALMSELVCLTPEEMEFFKCFIEQTAELTHYTSYSDRILASGALLSYSALKARFGGKFSNNSKADVGILGNGDNVFFRYELRHQSQYSSRFGKEHIVVKAESTALFHTGWISLYEIAFPKSNNILFLEHNNEIIRSSPSRKMGSVTYQYPTELREVDMVSTVFFGPDIQRGIALAMICELRRIGGDYQKTILAERTTEGLNKALSQLFRIEAKVPGRVYLDQVDYRYTAPLLMKEAIDENDFDTVTRLIKNGMSIEDVIFDEKNSLEYVLSLSDNKHAKMINFLRQAKDADLLMSDSESSSDENSGEENPTLHINNSYFDSKLIVSSESVDKNADIKNFDNSCTNLASSGDYLFFKNIPDSDTSNEFSFNDTEEQHNLFSSFFKKEGANMLMFFENLNTQAALYIQTLSSRNDVNQSKKI